MHLCLLTKMLGQNNLPNSSGLSVIDLKFGDCLLTTKKMHAAANIIERARSFRRIDHSKRKESVVTKRSLFCFVGVVVCADSYFKISGL